MTEGAPHGSTTLGAAFVRRRIRESADQIASNRDFLTQPDAAIGDAHHSINMDRGFSAAMTYWPSPWELDRLARVALGRAGA